MWTCAPIWRDSTASSFCELTPVISRWLKECYTDPQHSQCRKKHAEPKAELPHRVIDVGPADNSKPPFLRTTENLQGYYTALSHCWGQFQPFTTRKSTLEHNLRYLSLLELPKTFRDAIYITRGLGIRYLWIDSLCIVQDDADDWERESANMINVFKNAVITLAASAAADSRDGCCSLRQDESLHISLQTSSHGLGSTIHVRKVPDERTLRGSILETPLNKRAWVLQEMLLTSRVVHFARDQMYWQCSSRLKSEDELLNETSTNDAQGILHSSSSSKDHLWVQSRIFGLFGNLTSNIHWFSSDISRDLWWTVVEDYSRRQITRCSDKLPALAGLVEFFHARTGETPLAGLWEHDLPFGLLWHGQTCVGGNALANLPSWSWASLNGPVERCPVKRTVLPSGEVFTNERYVHQRTKILQCHIAWAGLPNVSQLMESAIEVSGKVIQLTISDTCSERSTYPQNIISSREAVKHTAWYFATIEDTCTLYAREDTLSPVGMASLDYRLRTNFTNIFAIEISYSSPFWDMCAGPERIKQAFHEVLLLEPSGFANRALRRVGAGIVYEAANVFRDTIAQKVLIV